MPFDSLPGGFWGPDGPDGPWCKSCKRPIAPDEPVEDLRFEYDPGHKLDELNGAYHAECARPFLSVKRALDMLVRMPG